MVDHHKFLEFLAGLEPGQEVYFTGTGKNSYIHQFNEKLEISGRYIKFNVNPQGIAVTLSFSESQLAGRTRDRRTFSIDTNYLDDYGLLKKKSKLNL